MKIQKFEYESLIRDSERLSIIDTVVTDYHYLDMQLLRILCGRQQKDIPNIQPTEPAIMIESVEEPAKESIHEIMEKFHSEEEPEPPKDSTPDENSTRCVDSSANRKKVDRGKVMALHKAGWSLTKIGEEMGCSTQRIHQIVKEENQK